MLKVLHILSAIDGGGGERVVFNYYSHIDRSLIRFDITAISNGRKQLLEDGFRNMGAEIIYVPKGIIARLRVINKILRDGHYDVIHCHRIFLAEIYMFLGYINHVPVRITHAHMAWVVGHKKGRFINWLLKPLLKMFTTNRLACGEAAARYVWGNLENVTILKNAVDLTMFSFDINKRLEYRLKINVSEHDILIGHVGRFNEQKNHIFLIKVFEALCEKYHDKKFHLAMIGVGELRNKIEAITNVSKFRDNYHYLDLQPDVYNWMNAFDLFLLPSLFEGLPVVGVEAQAAGLPCLFSDSVTSEFKIGNHVKFISLNASMDEWIESVYEYSILQHRDNNSQLITDMGYNINIEGRKLENIYQKKK